MNDTAAYLIEILMDDLGLDADEAVEALAETIIVIAQQGGDMSLLETAGNILADV